MTAILGGSAFACFMATNTDVLVLENHVLLRGELPAATGHRVDEDLAQCASD